VRKLRLVAIFLLPILLSIQPLQAQQNLIYTSSDGYITVGTWFLYNVSIHQENKTMLFNATVIAMNATHVTYQLINLNASTVINTTKNVSDGATFFWMNITLFIENTLKKTNESETADAYVVDVNSTFLWWRIVWYFSNGTPSLVCDHKVWLGNYSIIVKHWWYSRPVNQTLAIRSVSEGEQKLVEWWSPKFLEEENETTTPEQPPEEEIKPEKEFPLWWIAIPLVVIAVAVVVYMIASKRALVQAS